MLIIEEKPKSISAEAYRTLRTNITFSSLDYRVKSIMVTSAYPSDGKTTVLSNLAVAFAQSGKRVIVIDADMRKPRVHRVFKVSSVQGLSEVLIGDISIRDAIKVYNDNIHILNCGRIPPNPTEMLASNSMERLIDELSMRYDYVLVDSPPVLPVADAQILTTLVDGTILVAASGKSEKKGVQKAYNAIKAVKGRIIGSVVTKVKRDKKNYDSYCVYYSEEEVTM